MALKQSGIQGARLQKPLWFWRKKKIQEIDNLYFKTACKRQQDKICMLAVKNIFIPKLKTSHQNTESATSTSACVETGSKKGCAKTERKWRLFVAFLSVYGSSYSAPQIPSDHLLWDLYRKETQHRPPRKPQLTSNVCFKDRRIDINIEVHPLLQHVDNSLELRNISQDLQGNRDSGLEFVEKQRAAQYLGWF